jgi:DNA-binding MltR family transcriptional regulator
MEGKTEKEEEKKSKKKSFFADQQWQYMFAQFEKESDRAAVILIASVLDENLTTILKSYLVAISNSNDSLFESATSPLSNFSSKIDIAYRIGLISRKFARDLHIIRKIRNDFAHDIYGCSFENGSVISRIKELENSFHKSFETAFEAVTAARKDKVLDGVRGKFIFMSTLMVWKSTQLVDQIESIRECEEEWMYDKKQVPEL